VSHAGIAAAAKLCRFVRMLRLRIEYEFRGLHERRYRSTRITGKLLFGPRRFAAEKR